MISVLAGQRLTVPANCAGMPLLTSTVANHATVLSRGGHMHKSSHFTTQFGYCCKNGQDKLRMVFDGKSH